jgi:nucleoside phosphorylase
LVDALGGDGAWSDAGQPRYSHQYRKTQMNVAPGHDLTVVGTTSTSMGLTAAAIATSHLIHAFRPRIVVMAGIAAGTKSGHKQFGDVLVADPSVDYNSGKVVMEGGVREFLPDPYPIGLVTRLRSLLKKYSRPHALLEAIPKSWPGVTPCPKISIHVGPLGAADQVIDDESRLLEIQKNWRKLIGVEMETYGVYRACLEAPDPKPVFVSMKSVCDFAAHKTDSWQEYAAFTSARFAVGFLTQEWANMWPVTNKE